MTTLLEARQHLPDVKKILAIGSGKGGVGKSTISWYLAHSLSHMGLRIGILDADVYGPSLPRFVGKFQSPEVVDGKLIPLRVGEIACMSIGFLVPPDQAAVWRGPMIMTAVKQMLWDVKWNQQGPLDCLIVDLPPGTGDVPLTLTQQVRVDGSLIVTTSHPLAVDDAIRAKSMLERLHIPLMGVVENMTSLICEKCEHANELFAPDHHPLKQQVVATLPFLPPYTDSSEWYRHISPLTHVVMNHHILFS